MSVPKVIIDTDPGCDDALAIFMALAAHKKGELEVIAITTVHGNSTIQNSNVNAQRILHTVDLTMIPVYGGASKSLVKPWHFLDRPFDGYDGFGDANLPPMVPPPPPIKDQHAVWALIDLVKKYPKEIVLAAIGPLTNIALAMRLDPSFTSNLRGFYVMGGNTTGEGNITSAAEYNFFCDPEAARVVLEETDIPIKMVPLETCLRAVSFPYALRLELSDNKSKVAELMNKIEGYVIKVKEWETWITCDQMAMAWLIDDVTNGKLRNAENMNGEYSSETTSDSGLVTSTKICHATVEIDSELTRGQMVIDHMKLKKVKPNLTILMTVNAQLYTRYLRMAFGGDF